MNFLANQMYLKAFFLILIYKNIPSFPTFLPSFFFFDSNAEKIKLFKNIYIYIFLNYENKHGHSVKSIKHKNAEKLIMLPKHYYILI